MTNQYDPAKVREIEARREAATLGPYRVAGGIVIRSGSTEVASPPLSFHDNTQAKADAEFLASTWADIGYLLEVVKQRREEELLFDELFAAWQTRLWTAARKVRGSPDLGMETIVQIVERQLAEKAELESEVARLKTQLLAIEERDASICPEDVGVVELVAHLRKENAEVWEQAAKICDTIAQEQDALRFQTPFDEPRLMAAGNANGAIKCAERIRKQKDLDAEAN